MVETSLLDLTVTPRRIEGRLCSGEEGVIGRCCAALPGVCGCLQDDTFKRPAKVTFEICLQQLSPNDLLLTSTLVNTTSTFESPLSSGSLARACAERGITLVHVSSDYVFDGTREVHDEDEALSPLGVYGQSKAAGDLAVSQCPSHYVVRSFWVIGDENNFVHA